MSNPDRSRVIRFAEAQVGIATGERSVRVWQRGSLDVAFALPVPPKNQTPHTQDEIYIIIIRGRGVLIHDGKRDSFDPGDILFGASRPLVRMSICAVSTALGAAIDPARS